ncbi:MAG: PEP-CTERM sorting domain-containing protein [Myxococcales bacterium]|nr:PEP-CTERM sorting domain-containing protein [Myxococcales bacterium]MCH7869632.1 PEP-CTERM sorting domain-containing protein [Myxococcales bacterium]
MSREFALAAISSDSGFGIARTGSWEFTMVPEPSTGLLVLLGLTGLAGSRRSRR